MWFLRFKIFTFLIFVRLILLIKVWAVIYGWRNSFFFFFFGMVGYAWSFCWKSKYWNSIWNSLVCSPISQSFTLLSVFSKPRKWALPFYFTLDLFDDLHFLSVLILFHYLGNVLLQVKDPRKSIGLGVYR